MNRYEFLAQLHDIIRPRAYLEVGVYTGESLRLAIHSELALGIDPAPHVAYEIPNAQIIPATSDDFFGDPVKYSLTIPLDLAFIDGMHLYEYALRDFMNIEKRAHRDTVVLFDDVLPYNQAIASRTQPPGDWTGDVWKVDRILSSYRFDLQLTFIDTEPTGLLMVRHLDPSNTRLWEKYDEIRKRYPDKDEAVPQDILNREDAVAPEKILEEIKESEHLS